MTKGFRNSRKQKYVSSADVHFNYVALGTRNDCNNLIKKFAALDSVRFQDFCSVWKESKFSLIFAGRNSAAEIREFTEEIFNIAKSFLSSEKYEFSSRVGSLYLLYGLYMKQPIKKSVQIRMSCSEYEAFLNIASQLKHSAHLDGSLVCYLLAYGYEAFQLVFPPRPYGLERTFRKYHDNSYDAHYIDNSVVSQQLCSILQYEFTEALEVLNEEYYKVKCVLPEASGGEPEEALRLVDRKFAKKFQDEYFNLDRQYRENVRLIKDNNNKILLIRNISNSNENETDMSIQERRKEIRQKGFTVKARKRGYPNLNDSILNSVDEDSDNNT